MKKAANPISYCFGAFWEHNCFIKIFLVVDPVVNQVAVVVHHSCFRAPTLKIMVQIDTDHFEWRQETVIYALFQRVFVNRLTEISDVGNIFCFLRCGSHADLYGRIKIFEYDTPSSVIGGTSTMALINDDQVKEVSWKLVVDRFTIFSTHDGLIQPEINLI